MKLQRTGSNWDRSNRNGINNNWERLEGIIKSIDSLVANGQLTPSQYSDLLKELNGLISRGDVSIYDIDKNKGLLDQSFLSEELLKQIAGTAPILSTLADGIVTNNKVAGRAITPDKTTFFNIGENLWDGNYVNGMLFAYGNHDNLGLIENMGSYQGKTAIIKIEPKTMYQVVVDASQSNILRIGSHSSKVSVGHGGYLNRLIYSGSEGSSLSSASFTSSANDEYLYVYTSNEGKEPEIQVFISEINSDYIPEPKSRTIEPQHTTFFDEPSSNLFDGNYEDGMIVYAQTLDELRLTKNYSTFKGKTAIVEIEPDTTYSITIDSNLSNVVRIASSSNRENFAEYPSGATLETFHYSGSDGTSVHKHSITTSKTDKFLYIYVDNAGREPSLHISKGGESMSDYSLDGKYLKSNSIEPNRTTFFTKGSGNLFSGYSDGMIVYAPDNNELRLTENYSSYFGNTAIIEVKPNTDYGIAIDPSTSNVVRIGSSANLVSFGEYPVGGLIENFHYSGSAGTSIHEHSIKTGPNDKYLYVYTSNNNSRPSLRVTEGKNAQNEYVIPSQFLDLSSIDGLDIQTTKNYKYNLPGDFTSIYKQPEITDYISNPLSISPQSVHDMFISTVNNHSDIASYEKLGEDDFGYNLYKYESKPLEYYDVETDANNSGNDDGNPLKNPKIVITAGLHGREKSASYALYYFFRELLDNPTNNPTLDAIKTNIHLILMPICSPSGFVDNSYSNRNGQNINRDFPPYGNVTQAESKAMKKLIDDNIDMDYFIDFHNMFMRNGLIGYSLTDDEFFKYASLNMYKSVGRSWQKSESQFPQSMNHRFAYTSGSNVGTVGRYVKDVLGIPSSLLELARESEFLGGGDHGEPVSRIGVDILVNMITACIRNEM